MTMNRGATPRGPTAGTAVPRTRRDIAALTALSRSAVYAPMTESRFPKPIRIGSRAVCWVEQEVLDFIASRPRAGSDRPAGAEDRRSLAGRVSGCGRFGGYRGGPRPARRRRLELVAGGVGPGGALAEDDAPAAAVVPVAVEGLPAQGADPLDERRQCGQHHAGEGPALLGFGEPDSAGLLFVECGPKRAVVMATLGGGPRLVVGAAVQDPQGGRRGRVDRVVAIEAAEQAAQRAVRERGKRLRMRVN